jgi:hypothetical protein
LKYLLDICLCLGNANLCKYNKPKTKLKGDFIMISELAAFAGGVMFGTAGVKALGSKDAKKAYAHTAAFGLRVKDSVMKAVTEVKENANDILAEAKEINEKKATEAQEKAEQSVIEDAAVANSVNY